MFSIVYRCRREGRLLDREAIAGSPTRGELRVLRKGMKRVAVLLAHDGETYLLPLLDQVKLLAMNQQGVLLKGLEVLPPRGAKGPDTLFPQTWWCVLRGEPLHAEPSPAAARARERERQARDVGASMVNHYSGRGKFQP